MFTACTEGASGRGNVGNTEKGRPEGAQPGVGQGEGSRAKVESLALQRHRDMDFRDWKAAGKTW